jgi:hypothetical protein
MLAFGLAGAASRSNSPSRSFSGLSRTAAAAWRAATRTGYQTGENGGA